MEYDKVYYVDVLLPLHLPGTYTYRVPRELNGEVQVGVRVVVQFGRNGAKMYSALVRRIHTDAPSWKAKYIMSVLDSEPLADERQMEFWEWMAQYYMCYPGDVMAVALPAGLKLASESTVIIHPDFDGDLSRLSKYEMMVVNILTEHPSMRLIDLSRAIGVQKIMPLIRSMIERRVVMMEEELRERFVPRKTAFVNLAVTGDDLHAVLDGLEKKKRTRQVEVLLKVLQLTHFGKNDIPKRDLPQGSPLQTLIKNGVLKVEERYELRADEIPAEADARDIVLNDEQLQAYECANALMRESASTGASNTNTLTHSHVNTLLLHGVTSSGKTEVYIKLIDEVVRQGKQALLLLPEIVLTAQIINRLRRYFGEKVGIYHSRFSMSQRADVWKRTATTDECRYQVLVGARSALFLPFRDLALVIVDEEHDPSYKQQDPAPRYNARDAAIYLARMWGARTVLGSATPSVETYHNAMSGRYAYASMQRRYGGFSLPEVTCVDMRNEKRTSPAPGTQHFSSYLIDRIRQALDHKRQVILFQNRRGFSLRLECADCHTVPQCIHCDVSLVYHKATNSLRCHYCGYSIPVPTECPHCHSTRLQLIGIGTERVEEDLQIIFPEARVARMDLDSTLQRHIYLDLLRDFEQRRIDILVGTQMVTKGLDFENVSVVGIINADSLINYPNFRSYERAFQQMTQVSGRAGRHADGGEVVIQTWNPSHQVIQDVIHADYSHLYSEQIEERRVFRYPPFYRMVEITLKHGDANVLNEAADWMAAQLRGAFAGRVLGPEYPLVSRVRALYLKVITVRFERSEAIPSAKELMMRIANDLTTHEGWARVLVHFDVDPY